LNKKRAFYKAVADALHVRLGLRPEDVFINLIEVQKENWSFGNEWIEEPIVYDNFDGFARLSAELKTPIQIGENFYGSRDLYRALQVKACDLVMRDFMRSAASLGCSGRQRPPERRAFVTFREGSDGQASAAPRLRATSCSKGGCTDWGVHRTRSEAGRGGSVERA
jgi:phenylpyruvate tautomerase PptA (4-oxalocrotonate tautomerase family)